MRRLDISNLDGATLNAFDTDNIAHFIPDLEQQNIHLGDLFHLALRFGAIHIFEKL